MGRPASPWYRKDRQAWYVWHRGKRVFLGKTKAEAHRAWAVLLADDTEPSPPVRDCVAAYAAPCGFAARVLSLLVGSHGDAPIASLTCDVLTAWINGVKTWNRGTRWRVASILRRWLDASGYPMPALRMPYPRPRSAACMPTAEQHAALLGVATGRNRDALLLLRLTGCRPSEACNLEASSYRDGVLTIKRHKTAVHGRDRVIVLSPLAQALVERLVAERPAGTLLRGLRPRVLAQWLRNVRRRRPDLKLGGICLYGYRHAFATDALAAGLPDAIVAELLGHASPKVLHAHYAHVNARRQALKDAAKRIEDSR